MRIAQVIHINGKGCSAVDVEERMVGPTELESVTSTVSR